MTSKFIAQISDFEPCMGTAPGRLEPFRRTHNLAEKASIFLVLSLAYQQNSKTIQGENTAQHTTIRCVDF